MARLDLAYARALVTVAPVGDLARAVLRRAGRAWRRTPAPAILDGEARALAADALLRAPRWFTQAPLGDSYRALFPDGEVRLRRRAERILGREVEVFGRAIRLDGWHRDPFSGHRYDPDAPPGAIELNPGGADPKGVWEPARAGHLVELGAASRLCGDLSHLGRAEIAAQIDWFLDENRLGLGVHYASPLEVALRGIHWLAAVELAGGARAFERGFVERLGAALLGDLDFLAAHLEDSGVVPANHLLADYAGMFVLGLALDGAPGARDHWTRARAGLRHEAARQVGPDGAHFEASTAYHRFALELLLTSELAARSAGVALGAGDTVHAMLRYLRGYLMPDGSEPGFGDGDDARVCPLVSRPPRQHAYLLSVGVALFGDASLRPPRLPFAEEALWWCGPGAHAAWLRAEPTPDAPSASFPSGGVHLLRGPDLCVALRAGSYGQRGIGGHAHNDQLAVVVHAGGEPLIVDSGTGCYTRDPLLRDRFRGTAAHATVVVDGAEQSPILDGRPFALPSRSRAPRPTLEDFGVYATLTAEHHGYLRLRSRVRHQRRLTLLRDQRVLLIEDRLEGRGAAAVELRFPLAVPARLGASLASRTAVLELGTLGEQLDLDGAVELGDEPRALLAPFGTPGLRATLADGFQSEQYGRIIRSGLVSYQCLLSLPSVTHVALFLLG